MRRALLVALALVLATPAPAWADHGHRHRHGHHRGGDDGCSKQSCNHPGRHCEGSQDCSTKIGPVFICTVPQSCPQPKTTASLLPPTPQKIIGFVTTIFQEVVNFTSTILKLAV